MGRNSFRFFATGEEIRKCLLEVEKNREIKYVKDERYLTKDIFIYETVDDIPNLGVNKTGSQTGDYYIILDREEKIILNEVNETSGIKTYDVYEGLNPNSISFRPNGFYKDNYLIWSMIETMKGKESPIAYSLYKDIVKSFKKITRKIRSDCYISQEAERIYKESNGKLRLIGIGYDQPEEYDVKL